ncbi:MAG: hypothetical protein LBF27_17620 [Sphingobacterium sp.]|jgi:glucan phosphoethanolaminetransferase (alkaline phosphatase superfamily)|nr:hypothetical protein [Sphingobacterium sp.]
MEKIVGYSVVGQTCRLFIIAASILILFSGALWVGENTLYSVFWNDHSALIERYQHIRLLTVLEMVLFALIVSLVFLLVKIVLKIWKPQPIIHNICIQSAYIYGIMFIFIFDQVNDSRYTKEGFKHFKVFDLIEPLALTFFLFAISVIGFYFAAIKNRQKRTNDHA